MRLAFWGTPAFAVWSLRELARADCEVVAAITQPDRPFGRGRRLRSPAVKDAALELGIPVLQPTSPRENGFTETLTGLDLDLSVVVAYGHLIPEAQLEVPRFGSINLHASLLPALRGAAPVAWAIARGYAETGVSVMRMVGEMDAGAVISKATVEIGENETARELSTRLSRLGAGLLAETVAAFEHGGVRECAQDHSKATFAPKVTRTLARIDWSRPASEVSRMMRAMDDKPGAWSELSAEPVKLFSPTVIEPVTVDPVLGAAAVGRSGERAGKAAGGHGPALAPQGSAEGPAAVRVESEMARALPGTVIRADQREGLVVACGGGSVAVGQVQPAGKRRMDARSWIGGRGVRKGERFVW